jgi:arylsulfatase A-like enzyme
MKIETNRSSLLASLVMLTSLVFFAQLALVIANMVAYLGKDNVLSSVLLRDIFSARIVWIPLLQFLFTQLALYALYIAVLWYLSVSIGDFFKLQRQSVYLWGMFFWVTSVIAIVAANNYFFPRSFFTKLVNEDLFHHALTTSELRWILIPAVFMLVSVCIFSLINLGVALYRKIHLLRHGLMLGCMFMLVVALSVSQWPGISSGWSVATTKKPNIILIGLDALRPDYVSSSAAVRYAPHINQFIHSAMNFTDAYTSIAQTFPSWISLLTATEPKNNTVRANLTNPASVDTGNMLPKQLQQLGYETIFATDDLRFNPMLRRFGFDRIVGPAFGVNDFIIGSFNDFPLSNLLIPTIIGKWLFPYNYANHEAIATYSTRNFLQLIQDSLNQTTDKPLFLAVHFNASGWPFGSSSSKIQKNASWFSLYQEALPIADAQFGEFLQILKRSHVLDHAVVVLFSDHGITLGLPGDRLVTEARYQGNKANIARLDRAQYTGDLPPAIKTNNEHGLDTSYGYGGDVLSQKQYHVLLAFKNYGVPFQQPVDVGSRVSLLDIAPTILNLLNQKRPAGYRGMSLQPILLGGSDKLPPRAFFLESYGNSVSEESTESISNAVQAGLEICEFDHKTGLVFETSDILKKQLAVKERAIFAGDWLLAELPGLQEINVLTTPLPSKNKKPGSHEVKVELQMYQSPAYMVLLNVRTKQWTTELTTAWAKTAPLNNLCQELHQFYGSELACPDCCQPFLRP